MYRNTTVFLLALLAGTGAIARAQEAPRDTNAIIYDETFPGPWGSLILAADVAYRVEVTGADVSLPDAAITVRALHGVWAPPLTLTPLSDQAAPSGGKSWLLIPTTTGEYRIDVDTRTFLHVRVIRDGGESRRWAAVAAAHAGSVLRPAFGLRAVAIGRFPQPALTNTAAPLASGSGVAACAGSFRNGGCVLNVSVYRRGAAGSTVAVGTEPRIVIAQPGNRLTLAAGGSVAIASTSANSRSMSFWMLGAGAIVEWAATRHVALEAEAGPMMVLPMQTSSAPSPASYTLTPRFALGLRVR